MDFQLQIFLIIGVGAVLIAALILSNALLIYYVVKLYGRLREEHAYQGKNKDLPQIDAYSQSASYRNPALDLDEELNRRFTQYTPEPTLERGNAKSNKASAISHKLTQICWTGHQSRPHLRNPVWFYKKERARHDENITDENRKFMREMVYEKYGKPVMDKGLVTYENSSSLLKTETLAPVEWRKGLVRTGLIARKLGHFPLWLKSGHRIDTTLLQIADNHVVKYIPPGKFQPEQRKHLKKYEKLGCLMIGSEAIDPNRLTKDYMGLFKDSGVMPKKNLNRFIISPEAAILPGTPLNVSHFRVGDFVDVRGKTVDRGFQGVMRRWGFKGQPASHGVTKTHRRPGSIGGGIKHRVWPGKKMPGHMGNRWRKAMGLKIWRINTKTNCMWVSGNGIPGDPNGLVYIYDTMLPLRRTENPPFPTFTGNEADLPEEIFADNVHRMTEPTIFYEPEK